MNRLSRCSSRRHASGITTVEFAIVAVALFVTLFGAIEVSRMMYARTLLEEGTRRGARLAVVCPVNDPAVTQAAAFAAAGSSLLRGLTPANFRVDYLDASGNPVANPGAVNSFPNIRYVRVSVQNFTMPLAIPFANFIFQTQGIASTFPAESLGVSPEGVTPC